MGVVDAAKSSYQSNRDLLKKKAPFEGHKKNLFTNNIQLHFKEVDPDTLKAIRKQNKKLRKRETIRLWVALITILGFLARLFYTVLLE